MSQKIYIKPPPPTRSLLIAQIVVVALFLPFGAGLTFMAEGEARPFALFFALIWIIACLAIMIHSFKMLRLIKKGKVEIAEVGSPENGGGFADRLRALDGLKKEGLISEDEHRKKRAEIMQEKW